MEIILDHPHNGATVAYSASEAAAMEAKGWKIRKAAEPVVEPTVEPDADATLPPKKPGRKAKS